MDKRVFRMAILTIISAFILVAVIIYATNADKLGRIFGGKEKNEASDSASIETSVADEASYGQQIGDDLKAFLYDDDFFDEDEEVPAVVVIQQNTRVVEDGKESEEGEEDSEEEDGSGMAVVGQLDNPDAPFLLPDGTIPDGVAPDAALPGNLKEPPIEGTPVGTLP
ncbi:MAG: hypothetical protein K6F75_11590 [Butyrivibrio sp.]|nr:hypothetical protein [Butyrivibrio sp.]